ncbi:S1 family peptidase [Kutzneria chonburiensis]|uniref:S1 family peptidase n=1 Tax=Kutzneria chonburiensis TaxID=1483604 RepID=A0ABV6MSG5_9PSEU|nr:S1 family peptidase [Kutzneria chonburiensis]
MRRVVVLTAAVAVALPALVGSTVNAAAVSKKPTLDPAAVAGSMGYLEQAYGVTPAEALRRLELQLDATQLDETLRAKAAEVYGGMAIDHQHGGVLVVDTTNPAAIRSLLAQFPDRGHVLTRTVDHSLAELTAVRDRLAKEAGKDVAYLPAVDQQANTVVLWRRDPAAAKITAPDGVVVKDLPLLTPLAGPIDWGYCHPLFCGGYGPMRGGLRLDHTRADGGTSACTTGFNVRSTGGGYADKTAWVLTAGHCDQKNSLPVQHNGMSVVQQHGVQKDFYPYDYQFLPYVDQGTADTWLNKQAPHNSVLLYCMDSKQNCEGHYAESGSQPITGVHALADVKPGWVVCADGSASSQRNYPQAADSGAGVDYLPGTRCGQVTSTDVGINTTICARPGDSGGPLFSQVDNTALGILAGSRTLVTGACAVGESSSYSPIGTILDDVNAFSGGQGAHFEVITSANG